MSERSELCSRLIYLLVQDNDFGELYGRLKFDCIQFSFGSSFRFSLLRLQVDKIDLAHPITHNSKRADFTGISQADAEVGDAL